MFVELLTSDFVLRALMAGFLIAVMCGVMGCFVVWRRMAYFGDSLSHSALLGIAIGLATGLTQMGGIILICLLFSGLLLWLSHRDVLTTDSLLGILAHGALSFGMVLLSLFNIRVDLHALLFGDILMVLPHDLGILAAGAGLVLGVLWRFWAPLILMTINDQLAKAEGVPILLMQIILLLVMTVTVALSVQVVGILLITSFLIIPAATARPFARSPEIMAALAVVIALSAVVAGIIASLLADTPTGPTIVASLACLFAISAVTSPLLSRGR